MSQQPLSFPPLQNGLDYLESVVEHLRDGPDERDLKYAILHLQAATEVLLKVRLMREHWSLVFRNADQAKQSALSSGDFQSVGLKETLTRLTGIAGVDHSPKHREGFLRLADERNKLQHYGLTSGSQGIQSLVGLVLEERHRGRAFVWGAGHILLFGSIAATGAGLHVAAYLLEGAATLDTTATVLTVAVPVAVFVVALYAIGSVFLRQRDPFHLVLLAGTAGVVVLAVVCAQLGMNVSWCLVVLMLAPVVTVLGYETVGHRHLAEALARDPQL